MKACVIQPPYSMELARADECFAAKLEYLSRCDDSMDIIVLPEYSDAPCCTKTWEETYACYQAYHEPLLLACAETARRCNAILFVNGLCETEGGYRNTTFAFNRQGEIVGKYFKKHLPPSELFDLHLDQDYTREFSEPFVLEMEGLRFGFLTCYDFYFYEAFASIARQNVDIIIGCSLQRSDTHAALEIMGRFCAYNCNAHLLRASVSLDPASEICGASMIVTPRGEILVNMKSEVGLGIAEFDPKNKYYKPAGFGGKPAPHYEYVEFGRNPWQYRPGGSAIVKNDILMPYPRVCAQGGFASIAPENSLAAFGAAVGMGVEEIGIDLTLTSDGVPVARSAPTDAAQAHDAGERTVGADADGRFADLTVTRFEEILKKFSCHAIMNLRIDSVKETLHGEALHQILSLIDRYDCKKYVYFTSASPDLLAQIKQCAPGFGLCLDCPSADAVETARSIGCDRILFTGDAPDRETVARAHAAGLRCCMRVPKREGGAETLLRAGIDTLITQDCHAVARAVEHFKKRT